MALLVVCASIPSLHAQDNDSTQKEGAISESADEISNKVDEIQNTRDSPFRKGPISPLLNSWTDLWNWTDEHLNLTVGTAYTTLYQGASNGTYSGPRNAASGDFDVFGRWYYLNRDRKQGFFTQGSLGFSVEYRNRWTDIPPSDLGDSIGSLWQTTRGFSDSGLRLKEFWIQQKLFDNAVTVRLGRINAKNIFDVYRFNNANHFYLNQAFSDNPAMAFPSNGLGGTISWEITDNWYATYGIADASGNSDDPNDTVDSLFNGLTFGWKDEVGDLGAGRYQATLWHVNERDDIQGAPSASGFSLVAQQELGNGWVPYARYARSNKAAVKTRQLATVGAVLETPFNRKNDRLGLAAGWGQPHNTDFRNQWVGEIFYRWAIFSELRLTPSAQILVNPSRNKKDDVIGIFSLRARLTF
jgi:porin